jgi:endonuclease/exonuclease/phosphatase (EEP) superfamily protein YafD
MIDKVKPNSDEKILDILVCNVYQHNRNYQKLIDLVKKENPSVLFFLETDEEWQNALKTVTKNYEYKIEVPLANTYGLLFYSHFPVKNYEVNYLIDDDIPSIVADLEYNNQTVDYLEFIQHHRFLRKILKVQNAMPRFFWLEKSEKLR